MQAPREMVGTPPAEAWVPPCSHGRGAAPSHFPWNEHGSLPLPVEAARLPPTSRVRQQLAYTSQRSLMAPVEAASSRRNAVAPSGSCGSSRQPSACDIAQWVTSNKFREQGCCVMEDDKQLALAAPECVILVFLRYG